jgi:hypothetical protein
MPPTPVQSPGTATLLIRRVLSLLCRWMATNAALIER